MNGLSIQEVMDTPAVVSMVIDSVVAQLPEKAQLLEQVCIKTAQQVLRMNSAIVSAYI
ncbi:hypothetical protein DPMN_062338 [Dreissena polymorpha]|uniref:Uncharacterized protein n=1 Tax=Dreissena polymorpha TaxID=45954 RepID=A0A9D4C8M6_DREPO|nr:hypothetical protein DPMN_062297 [Dreissena polymorpha]KAH3719501.1 hypothetical protein DPMN_062338 [Dreissena polymorpha]